MARRDRRLYYIWLYPFCTDADRVIGGRACASDGAKRESVAAPPTVRKSRRENSPSLLMTERTKCALDCEVSLSAIQPASIRAWPRPASLSGNGHSPSGPRFQFRDALKPVEDRPASFLIGLSPDYTQSTDSTPHYKPSVRRPVFPAARVIVVHHWLLPFADFDPLRNTKNAPSELSPPTPRE